MVFFSLSPALNFVQQGGQLNIGSADAFAFNAGVFRYDKGNVTGFPPGLYELVEWLNSDCSLIETTHDDNAQAMVIQLLAGNPPTVVAHPDSAFVVPYFDNGDTMLVRQWRHAWETSSWEGRALRSGTSPPDRWWRRPGACSSRPPTETSSWTRRRSAWSGVPWC